MPVSELHRRVAVVALSAAARHGFALGGGNALLAHGIISRDTQDVDLFTDQERGVEAAAGAVEAALRHAGFETARRDLAAGLADRAMLRIRCSTLLRLEFDAPPIELRNPALPEQLIKDVRSKEGHQGGLVHAGSGCLSQAHFPAPPDSDRRGRHPSRFRGREQQNGGGVAKQGQHDHAPLRVRRAGHVGIEPASLFLVAGMTSHAPSM
jgi:hypothetical protein